MGPVCCKVLEPRSDCVTTRGLAGSHGSGIRAPGQTRGLHARNMAGPIRNLLSGFPCSASASGDSPYTIAKVFHDLRSTQDGAGLVDSARSPQPSCLDREWKGVFSGENQSVHTGSREAGGTENTGKVYRMALAGALCSLCMTLTRRGKVMEQENGVVVLQ